MPYRTSKCFVSNKLYIRYVYYIPYRYIYLRRNELGLLLIRSVKSQIKLVSPM